MGMKISVRNLKRVIKETLEDMNASPTVLPPERALRGLLKVPYIMQQLASLHGMPVNQLVKYIGNDVRGQGFDEGVMDVLTVKKDAMGQWTVTDPELSFKYVWDGITWNEV